MHLAKFIHQTVGSTSLSVCCHDHVDGNMASSINMAELAWFLRCEVYQWRRMLWMARKQLSSLLVLHAQVACLDCAAAAMIGAFACHQTSLAAPRPLEPMEVSPTERDLAVYTDWQSSHCLYSTGIDQKLWFKIPPFPTADSMAAQ